MWAGGDINEKSAIGFNLNTMITTTVSAEETEKKLTVCGGDFGEIVFGGPVGCDMQDTVPMMNFITNSGKKVEGTIIYENWDSSTVGEYELRWTFTPYDTAYETKTGTIKIKITPRIEENTDEITVPSLTAETVKLNTMTAYDINLDNKVPGSTYLWTSSDPGVAEVNSKSGLLKAKSEGKSTVICEITFPDKTKQILTSEVTVGYDENAPLLTETQLDLNPGDTFDINLENKIAKSKYRWVSSDRSIVTVNSANGVVTAKATGNVYVTCTITTPEKQVIVLRCDIIVTEPAAVTE